MKTIKEELVRLFPVDIVLFENIFFAELELASSLQSCCHFQFSTGKDFSEAQAGSSENIQGVLFANKHCISYQICIYASI